jgi:hypothetical protein
VTGIEQQQLQVMPTFLDAFVVMEFDMVTPVPLNDVEYSKISTVNERGRVTVREISEPSFARFAGVIA